MEIKENNNLYTGNAEIEKSKAKISWKAGLMAFFITSGLYLLLPDIFIYSRNYRFSIISVIVLAFGAAIAIVFSLYFTEKMLAENRIKMREVAKTSLISGVLFVFFYFISSFFYIQTISPTAGVVATVILFFGVVLFPLSILIVFVSNIIFYKFYEKSAARNLFLILFLFSIIFSFSVIGIHVADYYNCNFGKDAGCVTKKAVISNDASLCGLNKYANPHKRNNCIIEFGKNSQDASICDDIEGGAGRDREEYKSYCLGNVAINVKNPSLCEGIKNYKDDCYLIVSSKSTDIDICDNMTDSHRYQCVSNIAINTNNRSLCDSVFEEDKKYCYSDFDKFKKYGIKDKNLPIFYDLDARRIKN